MAKTWLSNVFGSKTENQITTLEKSFADLEKRTETLQKELEEEMMYNRKFFDVEPSGYTGSGQFEVAGIETTITPDVLLRLFSTEAWVYTAVMAIAETIAGLPWILKKRTVINKTITNEQTGEKETIQQEVWTDVTGNALFQLFQYPNSHTSRSDFLQLLLIDLIVTGDSYTYLHSDEDLSVFDEYTGNVAAEDTTPVGRLRAAMAKEAIVKAMYRLPSAQVQPVPKKSEEGYGLHGYVLNSPDGQFAFLPAEIVHIKFPNPMSAWNGLSPLMAAIMKILLERYSTEHMIRFYKSGARLGGMIESDKNLTPEQITRMQRSFENDFTGRQNFYRTLVLPNGMKYKPLEQNPVENTVIELAKANREAILAVLRVPPIKAQVLDNANYANANAQLKIFYDDTIKPRCAMITDGFNMKAALMPENRSYKIEFDFSDVSVLQDDYLGKAQAAKTMIDAGLTVNEVRKMVWKAEAIKGGEKAKAVEDIAQPPSNPLFGLSAPHSESTKEGAGSPQNLLAHLPGPMITSIMQVVGRVTSGKLASDAGLGLIAAFGVDAELAHKLLGLEYTPAPAIEAKSEVTPPSNAPELADQIKPTAVSFEERVAMLTAQLMSRDKLTLEVAIARAIEQAKSEGLGGDDEPPTPPTDGSKTEEKPTLEEFVATALSTMSPEKAVDQTMIDQLIDMYESDYGAISDEQRSGMSVNQQSMEPGKQYAGGMSKDIVVANWKGFIDKTQPMIAHRKAKIDAWFKKLASAVKNELGANIKSYGIHKSRDSDDADEITKTANFEKLIAEYIAGADESLAEAFKYGFDDTLVKFVFQGNSEAAKKALAAYAASRIKGITDTTMEQVRDVLVDSFEEGVAVTEISQRIDEKFAEIDSGRAETIARTETLTAVSLGRESKREEFKAQFPDTPLMKMWVSAQDDHVRDTHEELDGTSVGVDEEFKDGLRFPRDPNGDASEVINCRCTDITFAADDQEKIEDTLPADDSADDEG